MNIFVASWFYPPVTTSEAFVSYKLLSNSRYNYDVCSAASNKWSYGKNSNLTCDNINQYIINTDSFDEFIEKSVEFYFKNKDNKQYKYIMTRSFPPESQIVGLKIKKKDKEVKWIASFNDPIGKNPYELHYYIDGNISKYNKISKYIRKLYYFTPHYFLKYFAHFLPYENIRLLGKLYSLEQNTIKKADFYVFPTIEQCKYTLGRKYEELKDKCIILPHSYDDRLYPKPGKKIFKDKIIFSYLGHTDMMRTPEPLIRAMKLIKDINPELAKKIRIRFIGNVPGNFKDMAYAFFLDNIISFEGTVDYETSLKMMRESDWLIHIDGYFDKISSGSIFFAAKIADYIGAKKPILALTSKNSPAWRIVSTTGGKCEENFDYIKVARAIVDIVKNSGSIKINDIESKKFNAVHVAQEFDKKIQI